MGKLAQSSSKYTILAKFTADGTIEKPDVIGAVFGQTEGLLGQDMDLRELQKTGRIGRIDVKVHTVGGKSSGMIIIPSSLDSSETALIGACMETIERIGPCNTRIRIDKIEDVRISKRKYVIERAKELLAKMFEEGITDTQQLSDQIKEAVRTSEISSYKGLPAGPKLETYDDIIVVEGRADVINLLRCGIKNVIANQGTSVPKELAELTKQKEVTVFLDGDRGGDLILKELAAVGDVDFVASSPVGKEVEELTKKEIFKALREKVPFGSTNGKTIKSSVTTVSKPERKEYVRKEYVPKKFHVEKTKAKEFKKHLEELTGTRAAYFLSKDFNIIGKLPIKDMFHGIKESKETNAEILIFDGNIDQRLINTCSDYGIKWLVGMKKGRVRIPENVSVVTPNDLE